jgi:hypothetical protein
MTRGWPADLPRLESRRLFLLRRSLGLRGRSRRCRGRLLGRCLGRSRSLRRRCSLRRGRLRRRSRSLGLRGRLCCGCRVCFRGRRCWFLRHRSNSPVAAGIELHRVAGTESIHRQAYGCGQVAKSGRRLIVARRCQAARHASSWSTEVSTCWRAATTSPRPCSDVRKPRLAFRTASVAPARAGRFGMSIASACKCPPIVAATIRELSRPASCKIVRRLVTRSISCASAVEVVVTVSESPLR